MTVIDIIILVLLALAVFKGIKLSGWLHRVAPTLSENVVKVLSFIVIIVVVCLCVVLLSRLLEKVIKITTLGWINRLLGVLLSVSAVVLLIGVIISVIEYVNTTWFTLISPEQMAKSKGVQIISSITDALFPYLKQLFNS